MTVISKKDFEKLIKKIKEDLKHPVGDNPTPRLHIAEKK